MRLPGSAQEPIALHQAPIGIGPNHSDRPLCQIRREPSGNPAPLPDGGDEAVRAVEAFGVVEADGAGVGSRGLESSFLGVLFPDSIQDRQQSRPLLKSGKPFVWEVSHV
jgi:hypothetical protein